MTPLERKIAFRQQAMSEQRTLNAAAVVACGVSWPHLSAGIAGIRPMSAEVKQRFANYIGMPVDEVFPPVESAVA